MPSRENDALSIAGPAGNAERQRRLRQRRRDNAVALRLTLPEAVVLALIEAGQLNVQATMNKNKVADATAAVSFGVVKVLGQAFP